MGIEGNHQQLVGWRNLEELEVFNKTLYKVRKVFSDVLNLPRKQMLSMSIFISLSPKWAYPSNRLFLSNFNSLIHAPQTVDNKG